MKMKLGTLFLCLLATAVLVACTATEPVAVTRPVEETAVVPTTLPAETPTATVFVAPTNVPTALLSATPMPVETIEVATAIATSEVVDGWLVYQNDFYDYQFSYPPKATINTRGVSGIPSEERDEALSFNEQMAQLRQRYPEDICVQVNYGSGFVVFQPPWEVGGKYATPCGVTGIGAYDIEAITETVTIDQHPYTVQGWVVSERDEEAAWHSQFYFVRLGDGTRIDYGSLRGTEEQFLAIEDTLRQIVTSYSSEATALPVLTPTPTPVPGLVAHAADISVGDWSPDGRFLTYWTHTADDLARNPQFPPGDFYFYDSHLTRSCPFTGYRTGSSSWKRRHLWLPNGGILIFGDAEVMSFQPCGDDFAVLTERFPEPITRVVAHDTARMQFLLTSENRYWLFHPEGLEVWPVTGFAEGFENGAAFSPDGRYVALSGDNGGSYLLDTVAVTVTKIADWRGLQGPGGLGAPTWLDNERFLIHGSRDQGPLIVGIDGAVQNLGQALFDQATGPEDIVFATRDPDSGAFHILLEATAAPPRLYHSELDIVVTLSVPMAEHVDATFSPDSSWLLLTARTAGDPSLIELWVRAVDPTVSQPTRLYASEGTAYARLAPVDNGLALKVGNYINIVHLPDGERLASQGYGRYDVFPYAWTPDGRFLSIIGRTENGREVALFVLALP